MPTEERAKILLSLIEGHNRLVSAMVNQSDDRAKVVPDSVFRYTEMFMEKIENIVKSL